MFFELALAGVGGNTVREVKDNLSLEEARQWQAYVDLRGSLNVGRRLDKSINELHFTVLKFAGAKDIKLKDMLPYERDPDAEEKAQEAETSAEFMKNVFSASANKNGQTTKTKFRRG